ncbi:rRNA maturation RNase YbeY [Pseudaestuariivita sp.]|uniref:rRNA maturation RNase YbeY n=1 Tax=Pseudaestuariivita sp. TaxID=2211669 RepID=UPI004058DEA7
MHIDLTIEDERWRAHPLEAWCTAAANALADHVPPRTEVAVLATSDAAIAELNAEFRGKPTPTNVLSWPDQDLAPDTPGGAPHPYAPDPQDPEPSLGDIALAYETCAAEAEAQCKPLAHHVTHLCLHGLLHLLGYDHVTEADAARMEALEVELLGQLGIPSPYDMS